SNLDVLQYIGFGIQTIKKYLKGSPHVIAQLTLQLGHYKMFGRVPVTYELTQTVKTKMGQTEVIRACSIGVLEWCKAMVNVNVDHKTRIENFRQAEKAHVRYDNWASNGEVVD
ncbi:acyltransferase ChoActase/COT/CPT, partial [Melampsora americana]